MTLIDGRIIAENILERLMSRPRPQKYFAAFLVGSDPASASFLKQKAKVAQRLGVDFRLQELPASSSKDELFGKIGSIVGQSDCGGAIVQLPLPENLDRQNILNIIPEDKDCDALSEQAQGSFHVGRELVLPPSVGTVREILSSLGIDPHTQNFAVIGAGPLVGRPIASWLMRHTKNVMVLDKGFDTDLLKDADMVISGAGSPGVIYPDLLKAGAGVIDFGYGRTDNGISGDFDPAGADKLSFYTPTPGGTGPILVAKLFENFYDLNEKGTH